MRTSDLLKKLALVSFVVLFTTFFTLMDIERLGIEQKHAGMVRGLGWVICFAIIALSIPAMLIYEKKRLFGALMSDGHPVTSAIAQAVRLADYGGHALIRQAILTRSGNPDAYFYEPDARAVPGTSLDKLCIIVVPHILRLARERALASEPYFSGVLIAPLVFAKDAKVSAEIETIDIWDQYPAYQLIFHDIMLAGRFKPTPATPEESAQAVAILEQEVRNELQARGLPLHAHAERT